MNNMLLNYSREIGVEITLESLIDSHRRLRELNISSRDEILKEAKEIYERTARIARENVENGEYIAVEKLKAMTLIEIVDFLD